MLFVGERVDDVQARGGRRQRRRLLLRERADDERRHPAFEVAGDVLQRLAPAIGELRAPGAACRRRARGRRSRTSTTCAATASRTAARRACPRAHSPSAPARPRRRLAFMSAARSSRPINSLRVRSRIDRKSFGAVAREVTAVMNLNLRPATTPMKQAGPADPPGASRTRLIKTRWLRLRPVLAVDPHVLGAQIARPDRGAPPPPVPRLTSMRDVRPAAGARPPAAPRRRAADRSRRAGRRRRARSPGRRRSARPSARPRPRCGPSSGRRRARPS